MKMNKYSFALLLVAVVFVSTSARLFGQEAPFSIPFEHQNQEVRTAIMLHEGIFPKHTAVKPLLLSKQAIPDSLAINKATKKESLLKRKLLYEHLIDYQGKGYSFQLDPLFNFAIGNEFYEGKSTWVNTRGLQLQGNIGHKIAFYSSLYENQVGAPAYIDQFINTWTIQPVVPGVGIMPGQGIVREFKDGAWDFANATAYISYSPSTFLNFQFGHDRQFIGNGYRSLLLSDVAFPAAYFRLQAYLGPLQYTYWLMQHIDPGAQPLSFSKAFRKKYAAMGFLNWQVSKKLQLGVFQALTWPGDDSIGGTNPPSWQYMDPLVFLHPVHYGNGSEGNLLIGLNMQWAIKKNVFVYGQLNFDEIRVKELFSKPTAPTNKYAGQLGLKFFDAFSLPGLYLQAEFNAVRPYTYSHVNRLSNYGHYLQPLAHPSGANLYEWILIADYHLNDRLYMAGKIIYNVQGLDVDTLNYGSNIFQSYLTAVPGGLDGVGFSIGSGLESSLMHMEMRVGYLLNSKTNMKLEARYVYREQGPLGSKLQTSWFTIGISTSLRNLYDDF